MTEDERDEYLRALEKYKAQVEALADANGKIPAGEAYRLLDKWNRDVTYRGLNSQEVQALQKLDADDWKRIRESYDEWASQYSNLMSYRTMWALSAIAVVVIAIAYSQHWWWVAGCGGGLLLFVLGEHAERKGHLVGYMDGYVGGHEEGINRALGISSEEALAIHDRATQMELDQIAIRAYERHAKPSQPPSGAPKRTL